MSLYNFLNQPRHIMDDLMTLSTLYCIDGFYSGVLHLARSAHPAYASIPSVRTLNFSSVANHRRLR